MLFNTLIRVDDGALHVCMYTQCIYFALDEVTHNLVVEVLYGTPLDALLHILLLPDIMREQSVKHLRKEEIIIQKDTCTIEEDEERRQQGTLPAPPSESAQ